MKNLICGLAAATALLGASAAAQAAVPLVVGVDTASDAATLQPVQYLYGGHDFCWYDGGWRGPGFYWCGYAWRRGYGWGGGYGWRGWGGGAGWRHGVWVGGPGWHGHPEWGGWRGPHDFHGGWHGGWHGGGHEGGHEGWRR
jgi:hypothetical protein